jgi:DNA-binding IclR family transcriptional regulator
VKAVVVYYLIVLSQKTAGVVLALGDDQENQIGVRCVGAPIFDYTTKVIGAISVSGPANRLSKERSLELGPLVRDAALEVSRRMGYPR